MMKIMNNGAAGVIEDDQSLSAQRDYFSNSAKDVDVESDVDAHSTTDDDHPSSGTQQASDVTIARKESRMVACSKMVVLLVIVVLPCVIGFLTYGFVRKQETDTRNAQFENVANEIIMSSQTRALSIFDNLETVSVLVTSQVMAVNATWPFVVVEDFQVHGMVSNQITGAATLTLTPFVKNHDRTAFEEFAVQHQGWLRGGHAYDKTVSKDLYEVIRYNNSVSETDRQKAELEAWDAAGIYPAIWVAGLRTYRPVPAPNAEVYAPMWQRSPAEDFSPRALFDTLSMPEIHPFIQGMLRYKKPVLTSVTEANYLQLNYQGRFPNEDQKMPHSYLIQPVYDSLLETRGEPVAFLQAFLPWARFFQDVLPDIEKGITVVLEGSCGQTYTFELNGGKVKYISEGDFHDPSYDHMSRDFELAPFARLDGLIEELYEGDSEFCQYNIRIYPSEQWSEKFVSNKPYYYAAAVVGCFIVTSIVFIIYDWLVSRRQKVVMDSANKTHAIVSALYPADVRDRLMEEMEEKRKSDSNNGADFLTNTLRSAVASSPEIGGAFCTSDKIFGSKPIAELYPATTIMFADMVGFTAWSSVREPAQVFTLLESVYHNFDSIAKKRKVFKVETIGDCYVAVCGLPTANKSHAVIMSRFATDCLVNMRQLVESLEPVLGPGTSSLNLRIGLHSGPVTAGVLRGEKGRFQLFGDTMNTASRMESTSQPGKIQISSHTADALSAAGKSQWFTARTEKVLAKGKGQLETYWLGIRTESSDGTGSVISSDNGTKSKSDLKTVSSVAKILEKDLPSASQECIGIKKDQQDDVPTAVDAALPRELQQLVKWNVDLLLDALKEVVAQRELLFKDKQSKKNGKRKFKLNLLTGSSNYIEEVDDILTLQEFDSKLVNTRVNRQSVEIPPDVEEQLATLVTEIASGYRAGNPFHNFAHASHVTMSVTKLFSRIVCPYGSGPTYDSNAKELHDYTFGITSDPLTRFACILSALIHDLDHPGVPNSVLVKEQDPLAVKFNEKSVAESNSVDLALNMLAQPRFEDLRSCIYSNEEEFQRFRRTVITIVLATDIMDKDLGAMRKARWTKAFSDCGAASDGGIECSPQDWEDDRVGINRKATIVLEHLIQASDVAHTMQHWHVFQQWNQKLFHEMYKAYRAGRLEKNPAEGWYQGEIGFFDFYIIPLAKKLDTCGVFGVSSHEYLSYAESNRKEWVQKGRDLVAQYLAAFEEKYQGQEKASTQQSGSSFSV